MKSLYTRFCVRHAHARCKQKEAGTGCSRPSIFAAAVALAVSLGGTDVLLAQNDPRARPGSGEAAGNGAQVAALYELQAAFNRASTVRDAANGDPDYVIQQRIQEVLSLWTGNGWISFNIGSALDGFYVGNGDPANPATCPAPSDNSGNRGTLCTFFKYVAAPFQPANRFVSLAPTYKTNIHESGNFGTMYFECHFFNVAPDPATGKPLWAATGHLLVDGTATETEKQWLFSSFSVQPAGVPLP